MGKGKLPWCQKESNGNGVTHHDLRKNFPRMGKKPEQVSPRNEILWTRWQPKCQRLDDPGPPVAFETVDLVVKSWHRVLLQQPVAAAIKEGIHQPHHEELPRGFSRFFPLKVSPISSISHIFHIYIYHYLSHTFPIYFPHHIPKISHHQQRNTAVKPASQKSCAISVAPPGTGPGQFVWLVALYHSTSHTILVAASPFYPILTGIYVPIWFMFYLLGDDNMDLYGRCFNYMFHLKNWNPNLKPPKWPPSEFPSQSSSIPWRINTVPLSGTCRLNSLPNGS